MTESEALTKWCPHVRTVIGNVSKGGSIEQALIGNAYDENRTRKETCCIASACMMWRKQAYLDENKGWSGYCGLAGKP